ncbi:cell shape determination protein CcmA [Lysobacteraceae bacterium NML03-0222]|nr:cell shape determination protein CcmA [Xanthomonadaceae bacterium NML03-0222]
MVSWRDPGNSAKKDKDIADFPSDAVTTPFIAPQPQPTREATPTPVAANNSLPGKESVIAADLSIEGKIEGSGHVRIAGKFKGDVNVKGDLTIEPGAKLNGSVRAEKVTLSGDLEGNIESARRVDLQASSVMQGDIKAEDLTIASGARLRGHVECGSWDGKNTKAESKSAESKPQAVGKEANATV